MGKYVAEQAVKLLIKNNKNPKESKVGILGITFKEDCPDVRNSKVNDIIKELNEYDIKPLVCDPVADINDTKKFYNIDLVDIDKLNDLDCLIIAVAHNEFKNITTVVNNFFVNDLSNFYLDYAKDILYCDKKDSLRRRQIQTVIYQIIESINILLAPILCFTCEEINRFIPGHKFDTMMKYTFPKVKENLDKNILDEYKVFLKYKDMVTKALEEKRAAGEIGSSLETFVTLFIKDENIFNKIR
mgnify:CR=1 FL=1